MVGITQGVKIGLLAKYYLIPHQRIGWGMVPPMIAGREKYRDYQKY